MGQPEQFESLVIRHEASLDSQALVGNLLPNHVEAIKLGLLALLVATQLLWDVIHHFLATNWLSWGQLWLTSNFLHSILLLLQIGSHLILIVDSGHYWCIVADGSCCTSLFFLRLRLVGQEWTCRFGQVSRFVIDSLIGCSLHNISNHEWAHNLIPLSLLCILLQSFFPLTASFWNTVLRRALSISEAEMMMMMIILVWACAGCLFLLFLLCLLSDCDFIVVTKWTFVQQGTSSKATIAVRLDYHLRLLLL